MGSVQVGTAMFLRPERLEHFSFGSVFLFAGYHRSLAQEFIGIFLS